MNRILSFGLQRFPVTRCCAAAALLISAIGCGATDTTDPNDAFAEGKVIPGATTSLTLSSSQGPRVYLLHDVQTASTSKTPLPLVILLHGSGLTSAEMLATSNMDSIADVRHFFVVYPQGSGSPSDWNAGNCCGAPVGAGTDDIAYIKAVIADVSTRLLVDKKRIYVGGFSDGARMAYRVACQMSAQVAAVAAVSGSLVTPQCAPTRKMPIIAFHGTADPSVAYDEPSATAFPNNAPAGVASLQPAAHFWMSSALCKTITVLQFTPTTIRDTGTTCSADVVFYSTKGGVHTWPTSEAYGFSASALMVDFFRAHALP